MGRFWDRAVRAVSHFRVHGLGDVAERGVVFDDLWNLVRGGAGARGERLRHDSDDVAARLQAVFGRYRATLDPRPGQRAADIHALLGLFLAVAVPDRLFGQPSGRD